jgi:Cyclin, N-terminal domain
VSDTLFLAVSYLDRYLSLIPVTRNLLQLVGVTCLLLAAKYEEIYAPQVGLHGALSYGMIVSLQSIAHLSSRQPDYSGRCQASDAASLS